MPAKRAAVGFVLGLFLGIGWGITQDAPWPGLTAGLTLGAALTFVGLYAGRSVGRRGALGLPPLPRALGMAGAAMALMAMARPGLFFDPSWVMHGTDDVGHAPGVTVYTDAPQPALDQRAADVTAAWRQEVAALTGTSLDEGCDISVFIVRDPAQYDVARRFGASADFGFYRRYTLHGAVVVMRGGSGWGTLTHLATYRFLECASPGLPPFAVVGVATLAEKLTATKAAPASSEPGAAGYTFRLGYRSNWRNPDATLRSPPRDLRAELTTASDPSFLRSFFLYAYTEGKLPALLAALREQPEKAEPLAQVERVFGASLDEVGGRWHAWLSEGARQVPMLAAASVDGDIGSP